MPFPPAVPVKRRLLALAAVGLSIAAVIFLAFHAARDDWLGGLARRAVAAEEQRPERLLDELNARLAPALATSRNLLLGRHDPRFTIAGREGLRDKEVLLPASPEGGCGLRFSAFCARRPESPEGLYRWVQGELRTYLAGMRRHNNAVRPGVHAMSAKAAALASLLHRADGPVDAPARGPVEPLDNWPGHCLAKLNEAIAAGDLPAARIWGDELAAATFALADLHRWLALLLANHFASIDFQSRCRPVFAWAQPFADPARRIVDSSFPASFLMSSRIYSYLEIERQAEWLFRPPDGGVQAAVDLGRSAPAAVWMPPHLRQSFLLVRSRLLPVTQGTWDLAARSPYERTYLANMLYRASKSRMLESLSVVLSRFERSHPAPSVADLMDVLFYRAGFRTSGFRPDDRYDERLMNAAGPIPGDSDQALRHAHAVTHRFLGGWDNYEGKVTTLKEALDTGKLDCIRGTDMMGALFRDAGQAGYCVIRLCCGLTGHSVAAAAVGPAGQGRIAIADCLVGDGGNLTWPSAYFRGMTWPEGCPGPCPPAFSAELCVRGLDGYLFAEGYVIRGPHAGELVKASLPYLPGREWPAVTKVYAGPYPDLPAPAGQTTVVGSAP